MLQEELEKLQSHLEDRFLEDCRVIGLMVVAQYKIGRIHADFAIPENKLVIELDSNLYHSTDKEMNNDRKRDRIYIKNGWNILRIRGPVVYKNGEDLVYQIRRGRFYGSNNYILSLDPEDIIEF